MSNIFQSKWFGYAREGLKLVQDLTRQISVIRLNGWGCP